MIPSLLIFSSYFFLLIQYSLIYFKNFLSSSVKDILFFVNTLAWIFGKYTNKTSLKAEIIAVSEEAQFIPKIGWVIVHYTYYSGFYYYFTGILIYYDFSD